jgi:hypothetical protein
MLSQGRFQLRRNLKNCASNQSLTTLIAQSLIGASQTPFCTAQN